MIQFQVKKDKFTEGRLVELADEPREALQEGEALLKVDRFAFTANNVTYALVGERIGYWHFFPPMGEAVEGWGVIPVWGFADVVESKTEGVAVGDRFFGYFPPATFLKVKPVGVKPASMIDGSEHRSQLPAAYNFYRRAKPEFGYAPEQENARMMLFPLYMTAFCLWDFLKEKDWVGASQIIILSASSKTSIGLAYALKDDPDSPKVIGLTSDRNVETVQNLGIYDQVLSYGNAEQIEASIPGTIVDMSGNGKVLSQLHQHLGDQMKYCLRVGMTHWDGMASEEGLILDRTEFFFAPSQMQKRIQDWGMEGFEKKTGEFIMKSAIKTQSWLKFMALNALPGLMERYPEICEGSIPADQGLIVEMK